MATYDFFCPDCEDVQEFRTPMAQVSALKPLCECGAYMKRSYASFPAVKWGNAPSSNKGFFHDKTLAGEVRRMNEHPDVVSGKQQPRGTARWV